jgi:hypothetical protein
LFGHTTSKSLVEARSLFGSARLLAVVRLARCETRGAGSQGSHLLLDLDDLRISPGALGTSELLKTTRSLLIGKLLFGLGELFLSHGTVSLGVQDELAGLGRGEGLRLGTGTVELSLKSNELHFGGLSLISALVHLVTTSSSPLTHGE